MQDGWFVSNDGTSFLNSIDVWLYPIAMYNGSTDDEANFIGYGIESSIVSPFFARSAAAQFYFASLWNENFQPEPTVAEYNDALEGIWFTAVAVSPETATINGLTATFEYFGELEEITETLTYKDFDFWTYP